MSRLPAIVIFSLLLPLASVERGVAQTRIGPAGASFPAPGINLTLSTTLLVDRAPSSIAGLSYGISLQDSTLLDLGFWYEEPLREGSAHWGVSTRVLFEDEKSLALGATLVLRDAKVLRAGGDLRLVLLHGERRDQLSSFLGVGFTLGVRSDRDRVYTFGFGSHSWAERNTYLYYGGSVHAGLLYRLGEREVLRIEGTPTLQHFSFESFTQFSTEFSVGASFDL